MITVEITIKDEQGKVLCSQSGDAMMPQQWKTPADRPLHEEQMHVESDSRIVRDLFMWTYQPVCVRAIRRGRP